MAGKGKREPKPRAGPGALVDLNLWDVLLGLMEPAVTSDRDPEPPEAASAHVGGTERAEPDGGAGGPGRPLPRPASDA